MRKYNLLFLNILLLSLISGTTPIAQEKPVFVIHLVRHGARSPNGKKLFLKEPTFNGTDYAGLLPSGRR